jgi:hypothetical protein
MKIRDIFIDDYFYPEAKSSETHYLAFKKASARWEHDKSLIPPFNNCESMKKYIYRRLKS